MRPAPKPSRIPPTEEPDGTLTGYGAALARRYAAAVIGEDDGARSRLRATLRSDAAYANLLDLCTDLDADRSLAHLYAE